MGDDGVLSYEDICTTTCNTGYEVQSGDVMRTCGSDGMFNGNDVICSRGNTVIFLNTLYVNTRWPNIYCSYFIFTLLGCFQRRYYSKSSGSMIIISLKKC